MEEPGGQTEGAGFDLIHRAVALLSGWKLEGGGLNSRILKDIAAVLFFATAPLLVTGQTSQNRNPEQSQPAVPSTFKFSASTHLVLVPAAVTDKQGQPVTGLTADDFEILEDGKVQRISNLEEITAEASAVQRPPVEPNTFTNKLIAPRAKKLEIVLLDLLNTPVAAREEARKSLLQFLSKSADQETLVALLVMRANSVRMIHNFTSDPAVLMAAIRKVQAPAASRDATTLNTNGGDVDAEAEQLRAILNGQAAMSTATAAAQIAQLRSLEARADLSKEDQEGLITLECMQQVAQAFAAVPGRKSMFWVSTGFTFNIGSMPWEGTRGTTPEDWQRTMRMLEDANISIYPVDLSGINLQGQSDIMVHGTLNQESTQAAMESGRASDPSLGRHQAMDRIATMTGGRTCYNSNDTERCLLRARQDSAQYYMLAYHTSAAGKEGWRKLDVRLRRKGLQIRARTGFFFNNAARDPDSTRMAEELTAVTSGLEATSLPVSGQWQQIDRAGDQRKVHFALSIPPGEVTVDTEHEYQINVDFLVFAWNAEGKRRPRSASG
jgi:VWFA-related protein